MVRHLLILAFTVSIIAAYSSNAHAYPWMIRHGYSACGPCHTDPSGAGILTNYGRAQSSILLSSQLTGSSDDEPGRWKDFGFGLTPLPDWLLLQGWFRNGYLWNQVNGHIVDRRLLQMRADLGAHISFKALRASATLGYNDSTTTTLSERAWVTGANPHANSHGNLVSREHWVGVALDEDVWLVRAGRINLPFGLRNIEHTTWVRSETRTDINQDQQHGIAVARSGESWRAELMGIAGNFQVHPDAYRERGYSANAEYFPFRYASFGVSSLVTHSTADILTQARTTRQAHGVFARASPVPPIALLGELDTLIVSARGEPSRLGYVGMLQLDSEPWQGVHGIVTSEVLSRGGPGEHVNTGWWLSLAWFPLAHIDARADAIWRTAVGVPNTLTYLIQLQAYL